MSKRLLSALLAVVMVATMIVVPAYATEEVQTQQAGYCQHCKEVIPEEKWLPWDPTNTGPRTGHYYLANDIADQDSQITINLDDDLMRNRICLDLRGRSYTVTGRRPFLIYGIFSIMDSVGGGEIAVTGQTSNANGAFCQMGKSGNSKDGPGELNIYSGTIRRIETDTELVAIGGLIYMATGSTLNLHGGKLIGGTVQPRLDGNGKGVTPKGGTIYCTASNINIYGGTITGGAAHNGSVTQKDGTVTTHKSSGGNIYAEKSSKIKMTGGVVENGYCEDTGGNIDLQASTLNMSGGVIRGGYCTGASGNVNIGGTSTFIMSGGVIRDGVCGTTGGNLRVHNEGAALDISGGEIYGDIYANSFKSFKLSGSPKIYMGLGNGLRLYNTETKLDVADLTEGAEIYLDGVDQVFTSVLENPETTLSYFKDAVRADITVDETGALKVAQGTTGFCPHCWQTGEQATWNVFDNSKPNTSVDVTSQHAYLTAEVSRTRLLKINAGTDFVIDTAGKSFTVTSYKFANLYGSLSIIDSIGNGYITSTGHTKANGGVIMGSATGVFNMYSGTLSRTVNKGEERKNVYLGGILYAPAGSVTNIYGGTIMGGISDTSSSGSVYPKGGNICAQGTFKMVAGALIGGAAYSTNYKNNNIEDPIIDKNEKMVTAVGYGGNLFLSGTASISGGHIVGGNATQGGNVHITTGAKVSISGGVIRDGLADKTNGLLDANTDMSMQGGNIYIAGSASNPQNLEISNSLILNGTAKEFGGNIYATQGTVTLQDTLVSAGKAGIESSDGGRGGNIYLTSSGKCEVNDSIIGNGYAQSHGGNVYGPGGVDFKLYSGVVSGGKANGGYGGNFYCNGLTIYGGVVTGGTSGTNGGNIFVYETEEGKTPNYLIIEATPGKPAPIISNGKGGSMGGNINIRDNSIGTITGAIIENGTGDTNNKTGSYNADNLYGRKGSCLTVTDTVIRGIKSNGNGGNGIYSEGDLILAGNTVVANEEMGDCIFVTEGKLTVDASFCGETAIAFGSTHFANPDEPQGDTLDERDTATGVFTGTILLDGGKNHNYGLPAVFAQEGDNRLYVASTAAIDPVNDTMVWYKDLSDAAAGVADHGYVKLYKTENALTLNRDMAIDLNGNNLTVSGTGVINGFDSKNDDYTAFGKLTVAEGADVEIAASYMATNGRRYIAVSDETGTSFHRLGIAVTGISLRPSVAGVYYKATWECDDVLKEKIDSFGIAVSTVDMPGMDFAEDSDTVYTTVAKESFVSGQAVTGAMIENIVKAGEDNQSRGTMPIYAAAYAVVDGNTIVADDNAPTMGGVVYNMQKVLRSVDKQWPKLAESQKAGVRSLYAADAETFRTWDLYSITADIEGTAAIRPLKVLTLGHSLAVDSGHMLNMIADTEGYDQPMEIATLYYSGCPLYKHVNYIKNNSAVYELYLSSTTTPNKAPVITKGVTMEYGVKYADWDIIIMQGGVFEIAYDDKYQDGNIQFIQNYVNSIKTNPDSIFAWHMPWACPTDNELRDQYPYKPNSYYTSYEAFNNDRTTMYNAITGAVSRNIVTDDSFIYLIPSGTAIENALSSYLEEKDLHRDYVHVSDLGRVISSYTWYCVLAGIDQLDEIKLDAIPKAFLKSTSDKTQDRVLTDAEKAIVLESVNNALANPLQMTQSVYTTAP